MKIILGLGNPGGEYAKTRHNLGFTMLEMLASSWKVNWQEKAKLKAHIAQATVSGEKVMLVKPTTFYNLTGESLFAVLNFYKIDAAKVLVIHDELALPFGTVRVRGAGSDAGNNGIKNVISHVGPGFARLRIGIANELSAKQDATDFVLGKLSKEEQAKLPAIFETVQNLAVSFAEHDSLGHTSHKI